MTISKLIGILGALDENMQIKYKTDYSEDDFYVESFSSCRGNYEDVKLNCTENGRYKTAKLLKEELIEMHITGRIHVGYKGGEFSVNKNTKLTVGVGEHKDISGRGLQDCLHICSQDGSVVCKLVEN